jgi:hypothetical protein
MSTLTVPRPGFPSRTEAATKETMSSLVPLELRQALAMPVNSAIIITAERTKMVTCLKVAVQELPDAASSIGLKRGKLVNYYHFIRS